MTGLLSLAAELILRVAGYLNDKDLAHLMLGNHSLSQILSRPFLERALEDKPRVVMIDALTWAIEHGHPDLVQTIVNQRGFSRYLPRTRLALNQAAALGNCDIITILIGAGFPVEGWGTETRPLHVSVTNGHPDAVGRLLHHGAEINAKDRDENTPFMCAIKSPWTIFSNLRKTVPNPLSDHDELQLINTAESRIVQTLRVLFEHGVFKELVGPDSTPLHDAIYHSLTCDDNLLVGTGVLHLLVKQGASLSVCNYGGHTPIEMTVLPVKSNIAALNFFLNLGASPNSKDSHGRSLLSKAVSANPRSFPIVELLLKRGASTDDVELANLFTSSLQYIDLSRFDEMLTLLLIHGASFGKDGGMCFAIAAVHGFLDTMKMIFETAKADINTPVVTGGDYRTPLEIAIEKERIDMLEFLVSKGVKMSQDQKDRVVEILGKPVET